MKPALPVCSDLTNKDTHQIHTATVLDITNTCIFLSYEMHVCAYNAGFPWGLKKS